MQLFIFSIMSIFLIQWCVIFWANQWNMSDWVKYGNIWLFPDTYFPIYAHVFCPYMGKCDSEKTFIFAYLMQCPTESIGKRRYNILLQCTFKILCKVNFSRNRQQRVVLKRQASSLAEVDIWVPHGSTFGPLLFLIYINDPAGDVLNPKQFETDASLFSVVYNVNTSADEVNNDLVRSNKCAYQGQMSFNTDPIK